MFILGKPDPVSNCTVYKRMRTSAKVACQAGNDGGTDQVFHLSSQDSQANLNITSDDPTFHVSLIFGGLQA